MRNLFIFSLFIIFSSLSAQQAVVVEEWLPTADPTKEVLAFVVKYNGQTVARFIPAEDDFVEVNGEQVLAALARATAFADSYKPLPGEDTEQGPRFIVRTVEVPEPDPNAPVRPGGPPQFDEDGRPIRPERPGNNGNNGQGNNGQGNQGQGNSGGN